MSYFAIASGGYHTDYDRIVKTFAATPAGATDAYAWVGGNDGNEVVEASKDTPRNVVGAVEGAYYHRVDHTIHRFPPARPSSVDVLRAEAIELLRGQARDFPEKLFKVDGTEGGQRTELAFKRARNIIAYLAIDGNVSNSDAYAILKAQAGADWLEVANFAAAAWLTAYNDDQTAFYEWTSPNTESAAFASVVLPTATAGLTAPVAADITGIKVAQELR